MDTTTLLEFVARNIAGGRIDAIRCEAFAMTMAQMDATGADQTVTSCSNGRQTFDDGQAHFAWDRTARSLLELVADHLAERERAGGSTREVEAGQVAKAGTRRA